MQKITALLITFNEEKNIQRYLNDADYADEIIIVDSFSKDKTVELAKLHPKVKVFLREFKNFTDQRNFALSKSSNEWVTFFDADEHLPESLKQEIVQTVNSEDALDAYYVHRRFYFQEKLLRFSGMQSDKAIRLFRKSKSKYKSNLLVHELIDCAGTIGKLENSLDHYTYSTVEEYRRKLTSYSKLRAQELEKKNLKPNLFHYLIKPTYRFVNHYIIRLGFLDGKDGFIISKLHAESVYKRYVFLNDIYKEKSSLLINKNAKTL